MKCDGSLRRRRKQDCGRVFFRAQTEVGRPPQPIGPPETSHPESQMGPSGLDSAVGQSDTGPGNRDSGPGLVMSHLVPQPPPWAVAWSSAALSSRLSWVSHLRMQVEFQTARRERASDHLCSSQGGQLSSQGSLLAGRPEDPHCVRQL